MVFMDFSKVPLAVLFKAYTFISLGAVLITIFLASIIQGVMVQVGEKNLAVAIIFYLVSWFSLGAGAILFFKGRGIVRDMVIAW